MKEKNYYLRAGHSCWELAKLYGFAQGNIVKYLWRWQGKNGLDDLWKALDYQTRCAHDNLMILPSDKEDEKQAASIIIDLLEHDMGMTEEEANCWIALMQGDGLALGKALHRLIWSVQDPYKLGGE